MSKLDNDRLNRVKDLSSLVRDGYFKWSEGGIDLRPFSTIGIGGKAACVVWPTSKEEIQAILEYCTTRGVPYSTIGNGSNTVFGDLDVLINLTRLNRFIEGDRIVNADQVSSESNIIVAQSGVPLGRRFKSLIKDEGIVAEQEPPIEDPDSLIGHYGGTLAGLAYKNSLSGIEYLVDIPGTVGGAVVMNAGVCLYWMGRIVEKAVLISPKGEEVVIPRRDLHWWWWRQKGLNFAYRHSILQEEKYRDHILYAVHLILNPGNQDEIKQEMFKTYKNRREKHPKDPSVGSVFKLRGYYVGEIKEGVHNLFADELIKTTLYQGGSNFSGICDVAVYSSYPVIFTNKGHATLDDFKKTIVYVHTAVKEKTGIGLQLEVKFLPHAETPKLNGVF